VQQLNTQHIIRPLPQNTIKAFKSRAQAIFSFLGKRRPPPPWFTKFEFEKFVSFYIISTLPRPQALIKKFHASHYMKGLHEVVHRDEQAQGVMGLRHRKLRSA
jgi:hypothetical protein